MRYAEDAIIVAKNENDIQVVIKQFEETAS